MYLQPFETFVGHLATEQDAYTLLDACERGCLRRMRRRPESLVRSRSMSLTLDKTSEEENVIRSGTVIVFEETEAAIKRWRDGLKWTPSRILGPFLIYREVKSQGTTDASESGAQSPTSSSPGPSTSSLIKKTCAISLGDARFHIISYYAQNDSKLLDLITPSSWAKQTGFMYDQKRWINAKIAGGWNSQSTTALKARIRSSKKIRKKSIKEQHEASPCSSGSFDSMSSIDSLLDSLHEEPSISGSLHPAYPTSTVQLPDVSQANLSSQGLIRHVDFMPLYVDHSLQTSSTSSALSLPQQIPSIVLPSHPILPPQSDASSVPSYAPNISFAHSWPAPNIPASSLPDNGRFTDSSQYGCPELDRMLDSLLTTTPNNASFYASPPNLGPTTMAPNTLPFSADLSPLLPLGPSFRAPQASDSLDMLLSVDPVYMQGNQNNTLHNLHSPYPSPSPLSPFTDGTACPDSYPYTWLPTPGTEDFWLQ
ncbi:Gti1/Pac2 family-domain-containing protein [Fimicolochytrium jonesii]|uniref:Gti1/Pac2 family-domain-containing protein n=1 Tax=Fimicolochytrium jonesii TaxID=1396493 RepID=UPI0022FE0E33|nr:Gti1/Pac2 family-domain-containing protein [Fimicolochytrium jonesii]KAI8815793.1 Gti1/Pac2 family-domain-containing protein [Fimicolochytrium jonesii]